MEEMQTYIKIVNFLFICKFTKARSFKCLFVTMNNLSKESKTESRKNFKINSKRRVELKF